jgi:hypothetical protein
MPSGQPSTEPNFREIRVEQPGAAAIESIWYAICDYHHEGIP